MPVASLEREGDGGGCGGDREGETEKERGMYTILEEREGESLKTLFHTECTLGSFRPV